MAKYNVSYADQFNSQYVKSESHFVDLATRFQQFCDENKAVEFRMMSREFRRRNPHFKEIADLKKRLCRGLRGKLNQIEIDTTMQRLLDLEHVIDKFENFKPTKVMPIQVYEDPDRPGKYNGTVSSGIWSQNPHTTSASNQSKFIHLNQGHAGKEWIIKWVEREEKAIHIHNAANHQITFATFKALAGGQFNIHVDAIDVCTNCRAKNAIAQDKAVAIQRVAISHRKLLES